MIANRSAISELLDSAFSVEELKMLCFEHFQPVYDEFLPDTTKSSMIRRLVEYAERRLEITRLLESLRQANPAQYALHAERLFAVDEPTAAFSPLREPARSASAGVAALLTLLQAADVRAAIVAFQTDFEASGTQIRALVRGKRLHDLFQQLHDRCRLLEFDRRRLAGDATAWEGLLLNLPEAESIIGGLMDVTTAPALPAEDAWWVEQVKIAREDLAAAGDNSDPARLQVGLTRLKRLLGREPSRINTRLVTTADALRLAPIAAAIRQVVGRLPAAEVAPELHETLSASCLALEELDRQLRSLVVLHNGWQIMDDELLRIETNISQDIEELAIAWPDLKAAAAAVAAEGSPTSDDAGMGAAATAGDALRAVGLELEAALTAADPVRTRRLFHRYRSQANRGFNRVDQRLLDLCEQLQKTGEPLDLLLGALR